MITRLSIQSKHTIMQDVVHGLDVDTRYRFIHKLENKMLKSFTNIHKQEGT